jgi:HAD superfamily hydrolase (TIGR01484 family)
MVRKVIAFDLDGTLAPSKSPLPDRMGEALNQLLDKYNVCVISGGKFEQFEKQLLGNLQAGDEKLEKLHLMPTCGTRYYRYDKSKQNWHLEYAEDFNQQQKDKIISALKKAADELDMHEKRVYGEIIEDRGSQISWSALGQDIVDVLGEEGVRLKEDWDPDNNKKLRMVDYLSPLLEEFEVRAGGTTTIDITKKGIDKAYGMNKIMDMMNIPKEEIFFIGDKIIEGGNDYPVKAMGIDTLQISNWQETALAVEAMVAVS